MASSRKSLGSSLFIPFPNDGAHCALGNFLHFRNCFIPFPRSMPSHNSISEFHGQFLGLHGRVSTLTCTVNCGINSFLNHVQSIELATGGLQSSCGDIARMVKGNWMHLSSIWSVTAKGLNTYWLRTFQLFIFLNSFVKISKYMFHIVITGYFMEMDDKKKN